MDPYELLGVKPSASVDEAEAAYHHLLRVHHPDLHHGGTAQEVADAEVRTRLLNHAIAQIRAGYVGSTTTTTTSTSSTSSTTSSAGSQGSAGAHGSSAHGNGATRTAGPPPGQSAWENAGWPPGDPQGWQQWQSPNWDEQPGETYFGDPHTTTPCPLCGMWFARRDELTVHVKKAHHLRLARENKPSRFGGTLVARKLAGMRHVSLWFLLPFNVLFAALVAMLVGGNTTLDLSYWVFAVGMAPSIIRVLERSDDID